ncbi:HIT domain-containing protein [Candidatus Woesearchaeota archaeon]|nr:HIT domain-containing protein [Candidatus Woesearchaeota archaeon]
MATEAELQEQLKNMTPEQIRELQKQQCIFCRIAEGKVQARKVYEDEFFLVVLDINPGTPGHMLVMPKEHYSILPQLPEEVINHLGMLSKRLSQAALRALKAQGTTIFAANGVAAGQRASHFLLHVIPRMEGDGAGITLPANGISEEMLRKLQSQLQPFVDRAFGKENGEPAPPLAAEQLPELKSKPDKTESEKHDKSAGGVAEHSERDAADRTSASAQAGDEKKKAKDGKGQKPSDKSNLDAITDFLAGGK